MDLVIIISIASVVLVLILLFLLKNKTSAIGRIQDELNQSNRINEDYQNKLNLANSENKQLKESISALEKYQNIVDVEQEIANQKQKFIDQRNEAIQSLNDKAEALRKRISEVDEALRKKEQDAEKKVAEKLAKADSHSIAILRNANIELESLVAKQVEVKKEIAAQVREANKKREEIFLSSSREAKELVAQAKIRAEQIAGEAVKLAGKEEQLTKAIQAMKNTIKGYGEEYIIPPYTIFDELAEEYDFNEAGRKLKDIRTRVKLMVKNDQAAICDYVEPHRRTYAIHFVLDAFNGKVDTILSRVKHDNYGILKQQIEDAFNLVNQNGSAFRDARIRTDYLTARLEELKWSVAVYELRLRDQEEQRRIREEMREEEKARKEYEKAIKEAEKEERLLQKAMEKAKAELAAASEAQKAEFELKLKDLQEQLTAAEEKSQRALSMAQLTRRGHVYVISNHGAFGESIIKIGLTRRLDPIDRVRELGDASVPFPFDVHAIMFSDDSPSLEYELHKRFDQHRVNKVNLRKEFFKASVHDVKQVTKELGIDAKWTLAAEAREYKESLAIAHAQEREVIVA